MRKIKIRRRHGYVRKRYTDAAMNDFLADEGSPIMEASRGSTDRPPMIIHRKSMRRMEGSHLRLSLFVWC